MKILEGRYPLPGEPGTGILGKVEAHFVRILNGSRRISTPEQHLVRAVVRGILEEFGGVEEGGRFALNLELGGGAESTLLLEEFRKDIAARFEAVEGALLSGKDLVADAHVKIASFREALANDLRDLGNRVAKLETTPPVATPDPRIAALEEQVRKLTQVVNGMRSAGKTAPKKTAPQADDEKW